MMRGRGATASHNSTLLTNQRKRHPHTSLVSVTNLASFHPMTIAHDTRKMASSTHTEVFWHIDFVPGIPHREYNLSFTTMITGPASSQLIVP